MHHPILNARDRVAISRNPVTRAAFARDKRHHFRFYPDTSMFRPKVLLLLLAPLPVMAAPVINEIMFRPATGYPENPALEFVEIHNPDATAVNVSGWAFTEGIDYTLPAGTSIPAGGYLVVAADPVLLQAAHPSITHLRGPWPADTRLSNSGETLTLSKPGTVAGTWETVDSIRYADEGDWAVRNWNSTTGWFWVTGANGGGKTVERRNPKLAVDNGQNWGESTAVGGSPGAANSVLSSNVAPVITSVGHSPAVPKSTEAVTISCVLADELAATSLSATLHWRNASSSTLPAFTAVPMTGTGGGRFAASLPAMANRTIVEFYIAATDGSFSRTWPAPATTGQTANCQYQVDDEVITGTAPGYRLIFTQPEFTAYTGVAAGSNRQFNLTFISSRGDDPTIRYRASVRNRGNTSRNWGVRSARVALPGDDPWSGVSVFNINGKFPYVQFIGMRCLQWAGLAGCDASPLEVRRNGTEPTLTGANTDFGKLARIENLNGDYADKHWPDAPVVQIYRAEAMNGPQWTSTGTAPANPDTAWNGWTKQNRAALNDWSDIMNFCSVWQSVAASHFTGATAGNVASGTWNGVPFSDAEVAALAEVCDLDHLARYLAVATIIQITEDNISTGATDDYAAALVQDSLGRRRLQLIPYDLDNVLGKGDTPGSYNTSGLYNMTEVGFIFEPLLPLIGNTATPGNAAFRTKYLTEIRKLYGGLFDADTSANPNPPFHRFLENHIGTWVDSATLSAMKTFATLRQTHLLGLIGQPKIPATPVAENGVAAGYNGTLRINEVLAVNTAAHANGTTYPDVIELHNSGTTSVNISNMSLTDDPADPRKFVFPSGTSIPANGYLLVYADSATTQPGLHTLFGLDSAGETLRLHATPGSGGGVVDELVFGNQAANLSVSRSAADPARWVLAAPTLGSANGSALPLAPPADLRLNEWAGNTRYRLDRDFIELFNRNTSPAALGGMRLTDDIANRPSLRTFPPLSFIAGNGLLLLDSDALGFRLDGNFGFLTLAAGNSELIDQVSIVSQFGDRSTGRATDGSDTYAEFPVPSPGLSNSTAVPSAAAGLLEHLRITEIQAIPTGGGTYEFVELQNTGTTTLDLSGVRFTNGIDYTFPVGTGLAPGRFIVVCRDRSAFLSRHPGASAALAPDVFTGALDNSGETLALTLPAPWDVHILNFRFVPEWFTDSFQNGRSLTVIDAANSLPVDWGESFTWEPSTNANGTPGMDGPPAITSATAATAVAGDPFNYQITATRFPSSYGATGLPPGLAIQTSTGLISGVPTQVGVFPATISATNSGGTAEQALTLTVASSGPLAGFTWDYVPASSPAGQPFAVQVTARDSAGRVVTSLGGSVNLSASISSGNTGSPVAITEVTDGTLDQFELQNIGSTSANTSGWYVKISDGNTNINAMSPLQLNLPSTLAPGALVWGSETTGAPRIFWGGSINWSASGSPSRGWIMLLDAAHQLRDFVVWGWSANDLGAFNVTTGGVTHTGASITAAGNWSGSPVATPGVNLTSIIKRIGTADTGTAADFTNTSTGANFNATNANLAIPWSFSTPVALQPSTFPISAGTGIGYLSIAATGEDIVLRATDPATGQAGNSAPLDITAALADSDGDGMPDTWETANGLNPSLPSSTADADGDGQADLTEFLMGTDPRNGASRFAITGTEAGATSFTLRWNGVAGRIYRIHSAADPAGPWTPASPLILATGSGPLERSLARDGLAKRFFRVESVE